MLTANNVNLISTSFQEFYTEVVKLKRALLMQSPLVKRGDDIEPGEEIEQDKSKNHILETLSPGEVSDRLQTFMNRQYMLAKQDFVEKEMKVLSEAQYVMVALIDEIFLFELKWGGKKEWDNHLLEEGIFQTRGAGERFFHNLDNLLKKRRLDQLHLELAGVYLMALKLGFQGKYRYSIINFAGKEKSDLVQSEREKEKKLDDYRKKLWEFIRTGSSRSWQEGAILFPNAYSHNLENKEEKSIQTTIPWILGSIGMFIVLWCVADFVWFSATKSINNIIFSQ